MKLFSKRILSIMIIAVMFIASNLNVVAKTNESSTCISTRENVIINQAISLDQSGKMQGHSFNIVSLSDSNFSVASANNTSSEGNQAIQWVCTNDDGLVEVVTTVPYKRLPSGELVNSFNYASMQTRSTYNKENELVDGTFTIIAYFATYQLSMGVIKFYRHAGVEAFWSSDNSSMNVSDIFVEYFSSGELHKYPECLSGNDSESLLQDYYYIYSTIDQENPIEGQSYLDADHIMPFDRVIKLTHFMEHDGGIYFEITYSVNGRNYTEAGNYSVYNAF